MSAERVTNKRQRTEITIETKLAILKAHDEKMSVDSISRKFGINNTTIYNIIKHKEHIHQLVSQGINVKKSRSSHSMYFDLDIKLYDWYNKQKVSNKTITRALLRQKANEIIEFLDYNLNRKTLTDLLWRFVRRYNIIFESPDTNESLQNPVQDDKVNPVQEDEVNQSGAEQIQEKHIPSKRSSELDKQLYEWCKVQKTITKDLLSQKASEIARDVGGPGDMRKFVQRFIDDYNIKLESGNACDILQNPVKRDDDPNPSNAEINFQKFLQRSEEKNISMDNIYVTFQIDVIWNTLINTMLAHAVKRKIATQLIDINNLKKKIVTFMFCINITNSNSLQPFLFHEHEINENEIQNVSEFFENKFLVAHKLQEKGSSEELDIKDRFAYWFNNMFKARVKVYNEGENIPGKVFLLGDDCTRRFLSENIVQDDDFEIELFTINSLIELLYPEIIERMNQLCLSYLSKRVQKFSPQTMFNTEFYKEYNISWCTNVLRKAWADIVLNKEVKLWRFVRPSIARREEGEREERH
ncbi:uncharacterized protein LOC114941042 [Nylanderia fulva]|uniref:uncharacterized protein LOC114941042 n=1 Tax=Nylanderia fulva TaxID=613905 RepID=UPI0010FB93E3|nr:uncharacterized protein LOC114941042 [Nylanderia fulva]